MTITHPTDRGALGSQVACSLQTHAAGGFDRAEGQGRYQPPSVAPTAAAPLTSSARHLSNTATHPSWWGWARDFSVGFTRFLTLILVVLSPVVLVSYGRVS